jgi:hypothetical protein
MKNRNGERSVHVTECGIPGIEAVPYGTHLCHFYSQRQELVDGVLAYFRAGVENNERCIWVASDPLPAAEARAEILKRMPALMDALKSGQLQVVDAVDWYGKSGSYVATDLVNLWVEEQKRALTAGRNGLRVTGNTSFLQESDWDAFMAYENFLSPALAGSRIVALCSYSLMHCRPTDLLDVVRNHHVTLDRTDQGWQVQPDNRLPTLDLRKLR